MHQLDILLICGSEQLRLNEENFVPRFKTLTGYQVFLYDYYDAFDEIVIKKRYNTKELGGRIDRTFLKEYIR
jgi:hypothetical protein